MNFLRRLSRDPFASSIGKDRRFDWWPSFFSAICAVLVLIPILIYGGTGFYILIDVPVISLTLLIVTRRRRRLQRLSVLSALVVYLVISFFSFKNSQFLSDHSRWLLWSKSYKLQVLAKPAPKSGELPHIEWDEYGFISGGTTEYLVFDQNDILSTAAKMGSPGKFSGIPCEVPDVRRLESHWYIVMFYADQSWNNCT